jgi:hypothetical protein
MSQVYADDNTKDLILNNSHIEEKLHVVAVVSNPCNFKIRYKLMNEFIQRMEKEPNIILYIVELVYNDQDFEITNSNNKKHLQLRGEIPLWHKENMVNLGVKYLLPCDWKAFAWIDADIEFENAHWASDALKILNGGKDFIQLFTHAIDMDFNKQIMNTFTGFGYQYSKNFKKGQGINYWHPGFAWACNRKAYDQLGGILEHGILGSGDNLMCHSFIEKAPESLKKGMSEKYMNFIKKFQDKIKDLKLGYVPGPIRHYFHGKKENRNYYGREDILIKYQYDPVTFITKNSEGLLIPSESCPKEFLKDIMNYFESRNEDEMVLEEIMTKNKSEKEVLEYKINFILSEFEKLKKKNVIIDDDEKYNNAIDSIAKIPGIIFGKSVTVPAKPVINTVTAPSTVPVQVNPLQVPSPVNPISSPFVRAPTVEPINNSASTTPISRINANNSTYIPSATNVYTPFINYKHPPYSNQQDLQSSYPLYTNNPPNLVGSFQEQLASLKNRITGQNSHQVKHNTLKKLNF